MHPLFRPLTLVLALAPGLAPGGVAVGGETLTVFAAASLTEAMTEAGLKFEQSQGVAVRFSFAASSTLARQIEAGAPAGLVALASEDWADYLADRGLILSGTRISPIGNRLALIAPPDSPLKLSDPPTAPEIAAALAPPARLSLADPAHVPAGIYSRQSLENLGLWPAVAGRLALTDNVRAALSLVARGEAALGIVYATDARLARQVRILATLPGASHAPVSYPFAIVRDADSARARAFLAFLTSAEGLAIFRRFGFTGRN
ncbi:MAG: molybdate ABC transporter substrate-binding protein [Alphaproteobacteria bacterium]